MTPGSIADGSVSSRRRTADHEECERDDARSL
jgi:hypothetical protein